MYYWVLGDRRRREEREISGPIPLISLWENLEEMG
jgi:hypothetical protein